MLFRVKFEYHDKNGNRCIFDYCFISDGRRENMELKEYFSDFCRKIGGEDLFFSEVI